MPQKLITKGFGENSHLSGMVTQGYGGILQQVVDVISNLSRRVIVGGKSAATRIKKYANDIVVRVTLLSINDRHLDVANSERQMSDQRDRPRISIEFREHRLREQIRLNVRRFKRPI